MAATLPQRMCLSAMAARISPATAVTSLPRCAASLGLRSFHGRSPAQARPIASRTAPVIGALSRIVPSPLQQKAPFSTESTPSESAVATPAAPEPVASKSLAPEPRSENYSRNTSGPRPYRRKGGPPRDKDNDFKRGPPLMKRVLHVRNVARVNSGGKVRSVSALVVVGNGQGAAGYGEGRAVDAAAAVQKATRSAEKNMTTFSRFNNRTIFSNIDFNWKSVQLHLRSAPPGYGIVANNHIHEICRCIGISDLGAKVYGSRNPMNVIKATFAALAQQRRPEDIALARGKKVMDVELAYYGHNAENTRDTAKPER